MLIYRGTLDWYTYAPKEAFTLIIPTFLQIDEPILAYWEWAVNSDGAVHAPHEGVGVINSVTVTDSETKFGFMYDQYYKFDAQLVGTDRAKLDVTMRNPDGVKSSTMTLQLSYTANLEGLPQGIGCSVYVGKLTWAGYADNEMITIVVPKSFEKGAAICAYWQWTKDSKGNKQSRDQIGIVDNVTGSDELTIQLFQSDYYKFTGTVLEDKSSMSLTMSNSFGFQSPTITLHLSYSNFSKSRPKRLIFSTKSTFRNNKTEALICSLRDSGANIDAKNIALGVFGLVVASAGFITLFPAVGLGISAAITITGFVFASGALADAAQPSRDPDTAMLMPNRAITREATKYMWPETSNNDVTITKFAIENGSTLVIYTYTKTNLGGGETTLSSILPEIVWKKFLTITLASSAPQKFEACALVRIVGFTPVSSGSSETFLGRPQAGRFHVLRQERLP